MHCRGIWRPNDTPCKGEEVRSVSGSNEEDFPRCFRLMELTGSAAMLLLIKRF